MTIGPVNADLIPIHSLTLGLITQLNGGITPAIEEHLTYYLNHHDDTPNIILTEEHVRALFKDRCMMLLPTPVDVSDNDD